MPIKIETGVKYRLESVSGGTYITIFEGTSLVGQPFSDHAPQQWLFVQADTPNNYYIQPVDRTDYLAAQGEVKDKSPLQVQAQPYIWTVVHVSGIEKGLKFKSAAHSNFVITLDGGRPDPDTPVYMYTDQLSNFSQIWLLQKVQ